MTKPIGLHTHIQNNNLKSILLLGSFLLLLFLLLFAFAFAINVQGIASSFGDSSTMSLNLTVNASLLFVLNYGPWVALFGLVWITANVLLDMQITGMQLGASSVSSIQEPRLFKILEPLTIMRGMPMPNVEVVPSATCNAYCTGWHPRASTIGITRGALDMLNDTELESVLAHELASIEARDNRLITVARSCSRFLVDAEEGLTEYYEQRPSDAFFLLIFLFLMPTVAAPLIGGVFGAYLLANLARNMISEQRNYIADARAIEMVKQPQALIDALNKVSERASISMHNSLIQSMMFVNPSLVTSSKSPAMLTRISKLIAVTGMHYDVRPTRSQPTTMQQMSGNNASQPAFGKRRAFNKP